MKRLTPHEFIKKAKSIHGDRYDYSRIKYVYATEKVSITCKEHGLFLQSPLNHLKGQGCPKCARNLISDRNRASVGHFINKANNIHNNKYNYDKVDYKNARTKVIITCSTHGDFTQTPTNHLRNHGCPVCSGNKKSDKVDFIEKAIKVHGDKYNYDKVDYKNARTKVIITCIYHGDFKQTPNNHLRGNGCPRCSESRGEKAIGETLKEKNIQYEHEYRFKNLNRLPYDFCIFINNKIGLIEYQGEQHYKTIKFSHSDTRKLEEIIKRDRIKSNFADKQKIPLLVISYENYNEIKRLVENFIRKYFE